MQQVAKQNEMIEALQNEKKMIMLEFQKRMDKIFENSPPIVNSSNQTQQQQQQQQSSLTSSWMSYFYTPEQ